MWPFKKKEVVISVGDVFKLNYEFYAVVSGIEDGWVQYYHQTYNPFRQDINPGLKTTKYSKPINEFLSIYK